MRILAYSDLHLDTAAAEAITRAATDVDLILGAGDYAQRREGLGPYMARLADTDAKTVHIPGNNETETELRAATSAEVLHARQTTREGLRIFGLGGAIPPLNPLKWDGFELSEEAAEAAFAAADKPDILLVHSPPKGIADVHSVMGSIGSTAVFAAAERLQPRLLLCGHVHDCWGQRGHIGRTEVVNLGPGLTYFEL